MPLPRKASMRFRIAAAVLALSLLLAGCGKGSSDKVKTVVIENGNVSRTAVADISGDWYGWWRMYGTSGEWAQMDGCWWDCCAEIKKHSSERPMPSTIWCRSSTLIFKAMARQ